MRQDLSWCACYCLLSLPSPFFPSLSAVRVSPVPGPIIGRRSASPALVRYWRLVHQPGRRGERGGDGDAAVVSGVVTNSRIVQRRLDAFFGLIRWLIDLRRRHTREEGRREGRGMPWFQCLHHHLHFSCQYRPSSDLPAAVATSAYQLRPRVLHAKCC
jgi:hypothetical protein